MFKHIRTIQHPAENVHIWQSDTITAEITCFENGVSMVSLKSGAKHSMHMVAGCLDGSDVPTLLAHFAKTISEKENS